MGVFFQFLFCTNIFRFTWENIDFHFWIDVFPEFGQIALLTPSCSLVPDDLLNMSGNRKLYASDREDFVDFDVRMIVALIYGRSEDTFRAE